MNELEQHLKKHAEVIRMTGAEKTAMRFRIQEEMGSPTPVAPTRVASPYVWMFAPRMVAAFGVLLLVVVSTGSAYAAEGSLPGTPLYPVKTKIIEPLAVALAPTAQAKAQANADIAATRVQEAQTLAAQGNLTPEAVQQISTNYNEHAQAALALAAGIDTHDGAEEDATTTVDTAGDNEHVTVATVATTEGSTSTSSGTVLAVQVTPRVSATLSVNVNVDASSDDEDEATTSDSHAGMRTATTFAARTMTSASATPAVSKKSFTPSAATTIHSSSTATTTSRGSSSFVRTLRASLSAQAQILEQLDAQVRVGKSKSDD